MKIKLNSDQEIVSTIREAVSYTHLDVYKRQEYGKLRQEFPGDYQMRVERLSEYPL